jgi:hypothetical protein
VSFDQTCRELDNMSSATPGFREGQRTVDSHHMTSDEVVAELVALVRELHELVGSYAPVWYTETMDDRMSRILAATNPVSQGLAIEAARNRQEPR